MISPASTLTHHEPQTGPGIPGGNLTCDDANSCLYDRDGRICAVASTPVAGLTTMTGYLYNADGIRVARGAINAWSCDPSTNGFTTTSDEVLGPSGEQVTEMTGATLTWAHTNVWAAGMLLATYDTTGSGLHFYLDDPLGTRRVQTDYLGVVEQTCSSLPHGDAESCTPLPTEHLFTGKERDTESGNDYFGARYYASNMGRFMSPDWAAKAMPVPYAKLGNPQSLNLYGYVFNNPLGHADPTGHAVGTMDYFSGSGDGPGGKVRGGSLTLGVGAGGSASAYRTVTKIHAFGGYSCNAAGKIE